VRPAATYNKELILVGMAANHAKHTASSHREHIEGTAGFCDPRT
jgi:hypothetical protein